MSASFETPLESMTGTRASPSAFCTVRKSERAFKSGVWFNSGEAIFTASGFSASSSRRLRRPKGEQMKRSFFFARVRHRRFEKIARHFERFKSIVEPDLSSRQIDEARRGVQDFVRIHPLEFDRICSRKRCRIDEPFRFCK